MLKIDPAKLKCKATPALADVELTLVQRIIDDSLSLATGAATDYADYRFRVGRIRATLRAVEELGDAVQTYLIEGDED